MSNLNYRPFTHKVIDGTYSSGSGTDLTEGGTIDDGNLIIDTNNTEALLVRKDGDSGDILRVDTINERIEYKDGNQQSGYVLTSDASGVATWQVAPGAAGGEANTASNVGLSGQGIFKQKTGVDLEFLTIEGGTGITDSVVSDSIILNLDDTAVTPAVYGDSSNIPVLNINQQGRITSASTVAISGGGGGGIGGSITDNQIAFGATTADDIEGSGDFTYDDSTKTLTISQGGEDYNVTLDMIASFTNQPFFESSKGYYNYRPNGSNTAVRFYTMPNGTPTGTTGKFEVFNTDYKSDSTNYNAWNVFTNNTTNLINMGANFGGSAPKLDMTIGSYQGSSLQTSDFRIEFDNSNSEFRIKDNVNEFKMDPNDIFISNTNNELSIEGGALNWNVPTADKQSWTVFEPLHLGRATVLMGRINAATSEWLNNAYYDGSFKKIANGYSHRFSLDNVGDFLWYRSDTAAADASISWDLSMRLDYTDKRLEVRGPVSLQGYTVATLPSGVQGDTAYVTDGQSVSYRALATGGGSAVAQVFYDGSNWVYH